MKLPGQSTLMTRVLHTALLAVLIACAVDVRAQSYPDRPIKLVVPFPPGGSTDAIARTIQPKLAEFLGQPVVIDNKTGGTGIVAAEYVARQPNDGYTMLLATATLMTVHPVLHQNLSYDPAKDFIPVGPTGDAFYVAVLHPSVPANTLQEFIAYSKANPGKISAGVAGVGSINHFGIETFKRQAAIDILVVPYKGGAQEQNDLLGGQIQMAFTQPTTYLPHIKAGKLKAIAVSSKTRLAALPGVPTFDEAGLKDFEVRAWHGIVLPAGTPPAIVAKVSDALTKTLTDREVREKFAAQGFDLSTSTPDEFAARIRAERQRWSEIAKSANIKLE
jgi:tripartite-type tricarboxylate transporter receptor subunit TctC